MNSLTLTKTAQNIQSLTAQFRNTDKIIGIYLIKINNWKTTNFIPIIVLLVDEIRIQVNEKYINFLIKDISLIKIEGEKEKSIIKLKTNNDEFDFSLINIDDTLSLNSEEFNRSFVQLVQDIIDKKELNQSLRSLLPDQSNSSKSTRSTMPIAITSILMITLGIFFQSFNFLLAWFFVIGGILVGIVGLISFAFRRN